MIEKPSTKSATLPATACEPELHQEVQEYATKHNVSQALIIRTAVRFFLDVEFGRTDAKFPKRKRAKAS